MNIEFQTIAELIYGPVGGGETGKEAGFMNVNEKLCL